MSNHQIGSPLRVLAMLFIDFAPSSNCCAICVGAAPGGPKSGLLWAYRGDRFLLSGRASRDAEMLDLSPPGGWLPTYAS